MLTLNYLVYFFICGILSFFTKKYVITTEATGMYPLFIGITSENPDGAKRTRTADPLHAMQVLYQLSYGPKKSYSYQSI